MRWLPVLLLLVVRLRDALVRPPWHGYDAYAHLDYLSVVASGRLPLPDESWAAYHAPFYYLLSGRLANLLGMDPVRVAMVVSGLAGVAAVGLTYRIARRLSPDLAWPATLIVAMLPASIMAGGMVYNLALGEALWALFLLLWLEAWLAPRPRLGLEIALGLVAGLGLMTRPEGIGMPFFLGVLWLHRLWRGQARRDATLSMLCSQALFAGIASWFYLRNLAAFGRPFVHNADPDTFPLFYTDRSLFLTLPGFRGLYHYVDPGFHLWVQPCAPGAYSSFPAIVYASIWWDYFQAFLERTPVWLGQLCLLGGVVPTLLVFVGLWGAWRRRGPAWALPAALVFGWAGVLTVGITLKLATYCADKGSYFYPGFIPGALLAAQGLLWLEQGRPRLGRLLRILLVVTALFYAWAFLV